MNIHPWQLWSKDGKPVEEAVLARQVLEKEMKREYHPQISHLYIHLMELSPFARDSLPMADRLFDNLKGIAHLLHMPSHIYIQMGQYEKSLLCNTRAVEAGFLTKKVHTEDSFYEFYRGHDAHFVVWSAMFMGDYETAMRYSLIIKNDILPERVVKPLGKMIEFLVPSELHTMVRFGKWQELIEMPLETRGEYMLYKATQRYARTVAFASLGRVKEAEDEFECFLKERAGIKDRVWHTNTPEDVLAVAEFMARGEILYRKKQYPEAFEALRKSVELSDNLVYAEPWGWMQPVRHALAALLLEQNQLEESEKVYLEDLKTYPDNIWSLTGLEEIYKKQKN